MLEDSLLGIVILWWVGCLWLMLYLAPCKNSKARDGCGVWSREPQLTLWTWFLEGVGVDTPIDGICFVLRWAPMQILHFHLVCNPPAKCSTTGWETLPVRDRGFHLAMSLEHHGLDSRGARCSVDVGTPWPNNCRLDAIFPSLDAPQAEAPDGEMVLVSAIISFCFGNCFHS